MKGKMIDIIEDIGKGINMEQLAPKPLKGGKEDDSSERTSGKENA